MCYYESFFLTYQESLGRIQYPTLRKMFYHEKLCAMTVAICTIHASNAYPPKVVIDAKSRGIKPAKITFTFSFIHFHHLRWGVQEANSPLPSFLPQSLQSGQYVHAHTSTVPLLSLFANIGEVLLGAYAHRETRCILNQSILYTSMSS